MPTDDTLRGKRETIIAECMDPLLQDGAEIAQAVEAVAQAPSLPEALTALLRIYRRAVVAGVHRDPGLPARLARGGSAGGRKKRRDRE